MEKELKIIGARPYMEVRDLCHKVKEGYLEAIKEAAASLAASLPDECILVPVPGHDGRATYTARLATKIWDEMNLSGKKPCYIDALAADPHPSFCELKHRGEPTDTVKLNTRILARSKKAVRQHCIEKGMPVILIDNVVDTGKTARSAMSPFLSMGIENIKVAAIGDTGEHAKNGNSITTAKRKCNNWLRPFGLEVSVTDARLPENRIGEYEAGSVFEKEIVITVDEVGLRNSFNDDCPGGDPEIQIRMTVYHELGHAILEQIIDWSENLDEVKTLADGDFGKRYDSVFDDALPEEDLVEDFALAFENGYSSPLQACFEELNALLNATEENDGKEVPLLSVAEAAVAIDRFRNDNTQSTFGPFDLTGCCKGCGRNGCEYYATKISHPTGTAILIHNPCNGDWTKSLLLPEEEFIFGELIESALEWLKQ